ncbi:putative thioesterase [Mycobacterium xenopi 4042]|uniref:Putative thioesterase n=1 Tax=Mycobacterium xenopi 4042 TaxID=1299334 RepID=X8CEY6_MYCXE|nr:putative thioesterase [Mycobacterium xenopi 3993]EUA54669.1 putative thioesterase [Mycobacterium xenopi 4042]
MARHPGGGFNPPEPTTKGGPDYGRFIEAVRTLQDHARAVDAPGEVISEAADLIEKVSELLARSTPTSGPRRRAGGWICRTAATSSRCRCR